MLKFLLLSALAVVVAAQSEDLSVNTAYGTVIGKKVLNGDYFSFYGIHYAGSPIGANRFKVPTPPPIYPGSFSAVESDVICAHPTQNGLVGIEDCLRLDIHTRDVTTPKSVVVWLTGEEYTTTDTSTLSFKSLVEKDVLVVRLNYRLSIFGFLCLGVAEAPGNAGLKDVIMGLKWISRNIDRFGGDPENVILFGHGSGAAMVDLITLSPLSDGLIHKAIALSGSGLAPWAVAYKPVEYAQTFGASLGYNHKDRADLAKHLQTTDIALLASTLKDFKFLNNTPLFAPCIENPKLDPNNTFLSDAPINIIRSSKYRHVPYISGYTNQEGSVRAMEAAFSHWLEKMQVNFSEFMPVDLAPGSNVTAVENSIREFYFAKKTISMETVQDFLDFQGDTMYLVPAIRNAWERSLTSKASVFLFEFTYRGTKNSDWSYPQIPLTGVQHGAILKYLLNYDLKTGDATVASNIVDRVVNFTYTGVPNGYGASWLPVEKPVFYYLLYSGEENPTNIIVPKTEVRTDPHSSRMKFWNDLYSQYYKAPSSVSSSGHILSWFSLVLLSQIYIKLF